MGKFPYPTRNFAHFVASHQSRIHADDCADKRGLIRGAGISAALSWSPKSSDYIFQELENPRVLGFTCSLWGEPTAFQWTSSRKEERRIFHLLLFLFQQWMRPYIAHRHHYLPRMIPYESQWISWIQLDISLYSPFKFRFFPAGWPQSGIITLSKRVTGHPIGYSSIQWNFTKASVSR